MQFLLKAILLPALLASATIRLKKPLEQAQTPEHGTRPPLRLSAVGMSLFQDSATLLPAAGRNSSAVGTSVVDALPAKQDAAAAAADPTTTSVPTSLFGYAAALAMDEKGWTALAEGASLILTIAAVVMAIGAMALLTGALYDAVCAWRHRARFQACKKEVKRLHECYHSKRGDLPLCPCCLEHVSSKRGPNKVVFLCGHRFHVQCSNKWFQENPAHPTACPICDDFGLESSSAPKCCAEREQEFDVADGALRFMLNSLQRRYPDIISEECQDRWMRCHTEIWLSELTCPKYKPILRSKLVE